MSDFISNLMGLELSFPVVFGVALILGAIAFGLISDRYALYDHDKMRWRETTDGNWKGALLFCAVTFLVFGLLLAGAIL